MNMLNRAEETCRRPVPNVQFCAPSRRPSVASASRQNGGYVSGSRALDAARLPRQCGLDAMSGRSACINMHRRFYCGTRASAAVRNDESGLSLARSVIRDRGRGFDQAFHRLAGELSDEVEVLVKVQYGQSGEFSSRGDDQIRY